MRARHDADNEWPLSPQCPSSPSMPLEPLEPSMPLEPLEPLEPHMGDEVTARVRWLLGELTESGPLCDQCGGQHCIDDCPQLTRINFRVVDRTP